MEELLGRINKRFMRAITDESSLEPLDSIASNRVRQLKLTSKSKPNTLLNEEFLRSKEELDYKRHCGESTETIRIARTSKDLEDLWAKLPSQASRGMDSANNLLFILRASLLR